MQTTSPLNPIAAEHSQRLGQLIVDEINATTSGSIPFARFMELALYAPGLGYYSAGCEKFGAQGDFVTAPEITPLFGQCLARQCQQVLEQLQGGELLELGAGSGNMACDILLYLDKQHCLPERYSILEVSAELQHRQQQTLQQRCPHLAERVTWLKQLPTLPINGVILANEVMDAMPVHRFATKDDELFEYFVTHNEHGFAWQLETPSNQALSERIAELKKQFFPNSSDYCSEINLALPGWINALSQSLAQGMILLIDYGFPEHEYYHPQRSTGSLMCHYQHRAHPDPLINIGLQDITAHVDFTLVASSAIQANLDVMGYTNQAFFLLGCGLLELLPNADDRQQIQAKQAIKRLTQPHEMGELFKVTALGRKLDSDWLGFSVHDRRARL